MSRSARDQGSAKAAKKGTAKKAAARKDSAGKSRPANAASRSPRAGELHHAEVLVDVSRRLAAFDSLDDILEALVEMTAWELQAERGTLFLNDPATGELISVIAKGNFRRRIRIANTVGIAGHVFTHGEGVRVDDVYDDPRFHRETDLQTGFTTRNVLCVPIRTVRDEVIGVAQVLNKNEGAFTDEDQELLEAITTQASVILQSAQFIERMQVSRKQELEFLDVVADITSEIEIGTLLRKVMGEATRMLQAERSTLFLNDEKSDELWSLVGEGIGATEIRFPNHLGIAGAVFTSGQSVNIPHAYADLRFNPAFDRQTGFFTRSILCTPVVNKNGKVIGVTQVLNKHGGPFTDEDESRLRAFTAQVAISLENAKLFDDVQSMKNYNESMLQSMTNGVFTLDEEGRVVTCNDAGLRILGMEAGAFLQRPVAEVFSGNNGWMAERIARVAQTHATETVMDAELSRSDRVASVNVTVQPLRGKDDSALGTMILLEDITGEKRMKSTMSRYMDPSLADRLLGEGEEFLGGRSTVATVLFSDIRGFTTLTEELGAQGTVSLLNEYFTLMVDCIQQQGGMLDKFIGDAIMAGFGIPLPRGDDEDRALRAAIGMLTALAQLNRTRRTHGLLPVDIGIGLNTDTVVSGNIGSPKRMDYTMIGDGVNLASRLESACKQYHAHILISEHTYARLQGTYRIRDVDDVIVKGKTEPVRIYEVLDYHTKESFPHLMEAVAHFGEGREAYREGTWAEAIRCFRSALELNPQDRLAQAYIDRCEALAANPPADGWHGVWKMTEK